MHIQTCTHTHTHTHTQSLNYSLTNTQSLTHSQTHAYSYAIAYILLSPLSFPHSHTLREVLVDLNNIAVAGSRVAEGKGQQLGMKVKGHRMFYLLDREGISLHQNSLTHLLVHEDYDL